MSEVAQPEETQDAPEPEVTEAVTEPAEVDTETPEVAEEVKTDEETDSSPGKKDAKSRIEQLNTNWREAQREAEYWKAKAETPVETPTELPVKTLKDFEYDEVEYQKHIREVSRNEAQQEFQSTAAQDAHSRKQAEFRSNESVFAESNDDYYDVTHRAGLKVTPVMAEVIRDSDIGPAIHYHLGQNVELSQRLANMKPVTMAREIGKIEAALSNIKPKAVSSALEPAPKLKPVASKTETDPYKMTQEQYQKWASTGNNFAKWRRKHKTA